MSISRTVAAHRVTVAALAGIAAAGSWSAMARAGGTSPEIRLSASNYVPACATPERLTDYLRGRNPHLDPRFADIARYYRKQGEAWHVRWDYAFFQMIVETNALSFRRGNGDPGDVKPRQNNFAGIGTTGGGVPGDSFPDVETGVAAHIQHLVAYSGERLQHPVAPRTQLKQDDIVEVSQRLRRPVRFADLARRWAVDRRYWQSIEAIASAFRAQACTTAADLAPLPAGKAVTLAAARSHALPAPVGLGGEPRLVRPPAVAPSAKAVTPERSQTSTHAASANAVGPVRTIWRAGQPGTRLAAASPQAGAPQRRDASMPPAAAREPTSPATPSQPVAAVAAPQPQAAAAAAPVETATRKLAFAGALTPNAPATGTSPATTAAPPQRQQPPTQQPASSSAPTACTVATASYGGSKALLIRSDEPGRIRFTALSVLDGFEASMAANYIRTHARGGSAIGEFASSAEAVSRAHELCSRINVTDAR